MPCERRVTGGSHPVILCLSVRQWAHPTASGWDHIETGRLLREKARIVVGIDQTWAVTDQALSGDLELKYTVDSAGSELLLYRDSVAPHLLRRDRLAVLRSRTIALLPRGTQHQIARARSNAPRWRMLVREKLHRARARRSSWHNAGLTPVGSMFKPFSALKVNEHDSLSEAHYQRAHILGLFLGEGIEAAVLPAGRGKRDTVVIRESDREAAFSTLARSLHRPWYVVPLDLPFAKPSDSPCGVFAASVRCQMAFAYSDT